MNSLFNVDSPLFRFLGKIADLVILNILWIIFSIPLVTIGASTTALYYVTLKLVKNEEGYILKDFWNSFKTNFKQGTLLWLLMVLVGYILFVDIKFTQNMGGNLGYILSVFFRVMVVLFLVISIYIFPILAKFNNTLKRLLINAMFMSSKHFITTILLLIITVISALALYLFPILVMFIFSISAYCSSFLLVRVFDKYIPSEETGKDI